MAAPTVTVYRNGDPNFAGKKLVINSRQVRNMDALLEKVTRETKMKTAARALRTPTWGHKIDKIDKIQAGGQYVAVGPERFKKLPYTDIKPEVTRHPPRKDIEITPVKHSRLQMSGRARKMADAERGNNMDIFVYKNGDHLAPSIKVHLSKRELQSMDKVCEFVTKKVHLQEGYVECLATMNSVLISDTSQLENAAHYVAIGPGKKFKEVAYSDQGSNRTPRSRAPTKANLKAKHNEAKKTTPHRTKKASLQSKFSDSSDRKLSSTAESNKESVVLSPRSDPPASKREWLNEEPTIEELPIESVEQGILGDRGIEGFLHDAEHTSDSIYEASGQLQERAREILDDKETVEDKPIDLVPAEEVTEEIIEDIPQDNPETQERRESVHEEQITPREEPENQELIQVLENQEIQDLENQQIPDLENQQTQDLENQEIQDLDDQGIPEQLIQEISEQVKPESEEPNYTN